MALSSYEREELDRIDSQLTADSPRLAASLTEFQPRRPTSRVRLQMLCVLVLVLGIALWLIGLGLGPTAGTLVAIVGYFMVIGALVVGLPMSVWSHLEWLIPVTSQDRPHG